MRYDLWGVVVFFLGVVTGAVILFAVLLWGMGHDKLVKLTSPPSEKPCCVEV